MPNDDADDLWRDFPKASMEFGVRFSSEDECRAYRIDALWAGKPASAACGLARSWPVRGGRWFECASCYHQTAAEF